MSERGRNADRPEEIPKLGWKDILLRVKSEIADDRVSFVAAAVTFYLLLGLVPLMAAFIGAYGLFADPSNVGSHLGSLSAFLPEEVLNILKSEMERVAAEQDSAGISFVIGLLAAIWGGTKATDALIIACNIAYDEKERRNFVLKKLVSLALTVGAIVFVVIAFGLLAAIPAVVASLELGGVVEGILSFIRWPLLFVAMMGWLAIFYRYAPSRDKPKWRWVSWGALAATLMWVIASAGFSIYAANFAGYSNSYGSLGAIIAMMTWCFISGFCIMVGAELNAEMEHQTRKDSTDGPQEALGERDAHVADDVGEAKT